MYKKSRWATGLNPKTVRNYECAIKSYEAYHHQTINQLIDEAIKEQSEGVPLHQLSLYDRLLDFRTYLTQNKKGTTIRQYLASIKNIYKHHRVEVPQIPPLNQKTVKRNPYIEFKDILTHEEIRKAISIVKPELQIRMLAMATGGYTNEETRILTNRQFYEDTYKYHQEDDPLEAMHKLSDMDNIIWETQLIRQKTQKPYYGFVNPETTQAIARVKASKDTYPLDAPLFKYQKDYFSRQLTATSRKLGLGEAGGFSRLSPHVLRRFNATYLKGNDLTEEETIALSDIDELQGRSKTNTQDRYIKTNPLKQKLIYAKYMNNVSLYNQYTYSIGEDDIIITRMDNNKLKKENKELKNTLLELTESTNSLKNYIEEVGVNNFEAQLNRLLREL